MLISKILATILILMVPLMAVLAVVGLTHISLMVMKGIVVIFGIAILLGILAFIWEF